MLREDDAPISAGEIGRRMGISKNAVVGKVHRLGLEPRPSPIRVAGAVRVKAPPGRRQAPRLAQLLCAEEDELPPMPRPVPQPVRRFAVSGDCCFPIGEPRQPSFHFCTARSLPGKPYCEAHDAVAYMRVRDRREEFA